jgi:glycosyltransferase involved in cell wall biosynthesis
MNNYLQSNQPLVSIIIPCRNEEKFISNCLDSVLAQDYPKDRLEVLVVDGMSEDGTRKMMEKYEEKHSYIRLWDNLKRITSCALNIGIKQAKGDLIFWMSAHNLYEKDYISKCVRYLKEYGADNVGGIMITIPRENTLIGKAIAFAISHKFGVGNSIFRIGTQQSKWVDTVFGGCYKREIFEKIGLFNEKLVRSQDMDFNSRLKKAGLKILLVPDIVTYYYARSDLKSFIIHNFMNGLWAILPFKYTNIVSVSLRHLVPLLFVLTLIVFGLLSVSSLWALIVLSLIIGSYLVCDLFFSIKITHRERDFRYLFFMPLVFALLHITYGMGSLWGLLKILFSRQFWENSKVILKTIYE